MNREEVKKLQKSQLDILIYVDQLCHELNINYFMAFGSLLGAIRHNGSIPWDADIDIALFRKDFEILRKYCISNNAGRYYYSDYTTEKHHYSPHALLVDKKSHIYYSKKYRHKYKKQYDGIYIDIFPIDETSADRVLQKKQAARIKGLNYLFMLKIAMIHEGDTGIAKRAVKRTISTVLAPVSFRLIGKMISREQQKYDGANSNCYVIPTDETCFDRIVPLDYYLPPRIVPYESITVQIPNKAEDILTQRYGDYKRLPPEESRWEYLDTFIDKVVFMDSGRNET